MLASTICGLRGMLCYAKEKDLSLNRNKYQLGLQEISDLKHLLCDKDIQAGAPVQTNSLKEGMPCLVRVRKYSSSLITIKE